MVRRVAPRRFLLGALGGLLGALSFPLAMPIGPRHELFASGVLEPLAMVCLVPVLWACRDRGVRGSFGTGFWSGMVFFLLTFWWVNVAMTTFGGMPPYLSLPALTLLAAWCAVHWGLAFGLVAYFGQRFKWPRGATLAPTWAATELLRNYFCSGFPWGNLGYSQMRNLYFSQLGSLAGVYGVAFAVALINGAMYEVSSAAVTRRKIRWGLVLGAAFVLALGHLYGFLRVRRWDEALAKAATFNVAVVQGNIDQRIKNEQHSWTEMILDAYNPPTVEADQRGADLIVWPEAAFPRPFAKGTKSLVGLGLSKSSFRAWLLLGVDVRDPFDYRLAYNAAYLLTPGLDVVYQYDKHHLVPFGEYVLFDLDKVLPLQNLVPGTFVPGTELRPLEISRREGRGPAARIGTLICFDAIFPEISRAYVAQGADVLVNLSNDAWYGFSSAPFQFLRMVAMRAIETGRPVARAANTGISAFIDPLGRIHQPTSLGVAELDSHGGEPSTPMPAEWRLGQLPLVQERTLYVATGDALAYGASLFCLLGLAIGGWKAVRLRGLRWPIRRKN